MATKEEFSAILAEITEKAGGEFPEWWIVTCDSGEQVWCTRGELEALVERMIAFPLSLGR